MQTLYLAIGSPESIRGLQVIIGVERRKQAGDLIPRGASFNLVQRIRIIEKLNSNVAYMCFLRRCHIHQLLSDYDACGAKNIDSFVNLTPIDLERSMSRGQPGNPNYRDDSEVSKKMMKELYPALTPLESTYRSKLRFVGGLRNLGKRIQLLVERFGHGIIGLLPVAVDTSAKDLTLNVTDKL